MSSRLPDEGVPRPSGRAPAVSPHGHGCGPRGRWRCVRRHAATVRRLPRGARRAAAAADLERDDDPLPRAKARHLLAHAENFGDALVSEVQWKRERGGAHDQPAVQVAGCDRDRMNDRSKRPGRRRLRDIPPDEAADRRGDECPHSRPSRAHPLPGAIAGGGRQAADTKPGIAFEGDPCRGGGHR